MLSMVTSNTRPDGSRGLQIKGSQHHWTAIKTRKTADDFDDIDTNINSNGNKQKIEINAQNNQTQQPTKKQKLSGKGSKDTVANVNINQNNSKTNKSNGTDAILLHYIILDGLTSSWREFLALHDLGSKVKLLPDILAISVKEMYSSSTPTVSTPSASQEDSYNHTDITRDYTGTGHNSSGYGF